MRKSIAAVLVLLVATIPGVKSVSAEDVTFSFSNIADVPYSATQTQTGTFGIYVSDPTGFDSLYQYQAEVRLNQAGSQIQFTSDYFPSPLPGSFPDNTPPTYSATEASTINVSDEIASLVFLQPFVILEVGFEVPAGTPVGTYALTFNQSNPLTDPAADWINTISFANTSKISPESVINGAIVVTPEPGSIVLLALGAAGLLLAARRRR